MGWEYHSISFNFSEDAVFSTGGLFDSDRFNQELNRLGWDGWELVNVFDTNHIKGATRYVVAVFKRPLTPERKVEIAKAAGK